MEEEAKPIIYVVDDDESVRRALSRLIRSAGLRVETFESATQLLESSFSDRNACLISDLKMPGPNGLELQHMLADAGRVLPVILITGFDSEETRAQAKRAGVAGYFRKPVDGEALLDAIRWALQSRNDDP